MSSSNNRAGALAGAVPPRAVDTAGAPFRVGILNGRGLGWLLGCRSMLKGPEAAERIELVAIADSRVQEAEQLARLLEVPTVHPSLEAMVRRERLDGLIVASRPEEQAQATLFALLHGIHVFCEEPFGTSAEEALRMIAAARQADRVLAAAYPSQVQAEWPLQRLREGGIGNIELVQAVWQHPRAAFLDDADRLGFWDLEARSDSPIRSLLAVALPALGSPVRSATAIVSGDEGRPFLALQFEGYRGAHGRLEAIEGPGKAGHRFYVQCNGSEGELRIPLTAHELDPGSSSPRLIRALRDPEVGPTLRLKGAAALGQMENWVGACLGQEELGSRPKEMLAIHDLLGRFASVR